MRLLPAIHAEDVITVRMRQRRPEIARIGIKRGPDGWRCEHVWFANDSPMLSDSQKMALLAEADVILADMLRENEIVEGRTTGNS